MLNRFHDLNANVPYIRALYLDNVRNLFILLNMRIFPIR
jgi:hypothetical protein